MGERLRGHVARKVGRTLLMAGGLSAALAMAAGCGANDDKAVTRTQAAQTVRYEQERALFQQRCGACHTLIDADTHGTAAGGEADFDGIRPNISSVLNYVEHRIGKMPDLSGKLSPEERRALATYIADVDGCGIRSPTACDP